jgi:histidinol-phosphate/aromatic aminotransferase/cobyric acid decarboxylase-like protein
MTQSEVTLFPEPATMPSYPCPTCRLAGSCRSWASGEEITASNNAVGPRMANYVPLPELSLDILSRNLGYLPTNDNTHPQVARFKANVAKLEGVPAGSVRLTGSLLELFTVLPGWLGRKSAWRLAGDFPAYTRFLTGLPTFEILIDLSAEAIDPREVAAAIEGVEQPIVYLTFPVTNPYQQRTSAAIVEAVLAANAEAVVVVDNAYRRYGEMTELAVLACAHERVIYVNTASKDLFLCGARVGWLIAGPELLARIDPHVGPYVPSPVSIEQLNSFLESPATLERILDTAVAARGILEDAAASLGRRVRTGPGPWVMIYYGDEAAWTSDALLSGHLIRVQPQAGLLAGWLRISATVPCQAERIAGALRDLAGSAAS